LTPLVLVHSNPNAICISSSLAGLGAAPTTPVAAENFIRCQRSAGQRDGSTAACSVAVRIAVRSDDLRMLASRPVVFSKLAP
jgi:hypothetical protein